MLGRKFVLGELVCDTQAQKLKSSVYSFLNAQRPLGNIVKPGYHLLFFNAQSHEQDLSSDGYDSRQAPADSSFKRRMWIGGQMDFLQPLQFNREASCTETIKRFRKIRDNHYVDVDREIKQDDQLCIRELRQFIYTNQLYQELEPKTQDFKPQFSHELTPTDLLLFRYSGLTFNAHKIHYNKEYARSEGYPDILVQGPLTVTLLLEWVDTMFDNLKVKSFKYKNSSPTFSNEKIRLCLKENDRFLNLWIENAQDGRMLVDAQLTFDE